MREKLGWRCATGAMSSRAATSPGVSTTSPTGQVRFSDSGIEVVPAAAEHRGPHRVGRGQTLHREPDVMLGFPSGCGAAQATPRPGRAHRAGLGRRRCPAIPTPAAGQAGHLLGIETRVVRWSNPREQNASLRFCPGIQLGHAAADRSLQRSPRCPQPRHPCRETYPSTEDTRTGFAVRICGDRGVIGLVHRKALRQDLPEDPPQGNPDHHGGRGSAGPALNRRRAHARAAQLALTDLFGAIPAGRGRRHGWASTDSSTGSRRRLPVRRRVPLGTALSASQHLLSEDHRGRTTATATNSWAGATFVGVRPTRSR